MELPIEDELCAYRSHVPDSTIYRASNLSKTAPFRRCGKRHVACMRQSQSGDDPLPAWSHEPADSPDSQQGSRQARLVIVKGQSALVDACVHRTRFQTLPSVISSRLRCVFASLFYRLRRFLLRSFCGKLNDYWARFLPLRAAQSSRVGSSCRVANIHGSKVHTEFLHHRAH